MDLRISPALADLPLINSNDVDDLQGNLKDLDETNYAKLKNSLLSEGFIFPLMIWREPSTGAMYSFDGHQRLRLIQRELPGGVMLPYIRVEARDRDEAKKKLLLFNSQYGVVTKEGWDEFIADLADTSFVNDLTTFGGFLDENWQSDLGNDENSDTSSSDKGLDADNVTYRVEAVCVSEREQEELFNELTERGYQCKVLTL